LQKVRKADLKAVTSSEKNAEISGVLTQDIAHLQKLFDRCSDFVCREFQIGSSKAAIFYFDGMVKTETVNDEILRSLILETRMAKSEQTEKNRLTDFLEQHALTVGEIERVDTWTEALAALYVGDTLLLLDGCEEAFVLNSKGFPQRSVDKAGNEKVLRGPEEAFNETLRVNTALIRKRVKSYNLKMESLTLGVNTQTKVVLAYLEDVANPSIVAEAKKRLESLQGVKGIMESSGIEQMIEDNPQSVFPQIQYSERPDRVCQAMTEGRIAILVDGSPNVLIIPALLVQLLQSPDDYYNRAKAGTFMRFIRYIGIAVALLFPSLYVAITSYHPEMLPLNLLLSIAAAREGVPFPAFVEALLMALAFELLREASLRMPSAIGNTIGIVGALVIGEAAVSANLVAPQMIVVVSLTAIGSFTLPSIEASYPVRLLRFPLMILAAILGLYGVMLGVIAILIHLIKLKSFGYPYLAPLAPLSVSGAKDMFIRRSRKDVRQNVLFQQPPQYSVGRSLDGTKIIPE